MIYLGINKERGMNIIDNDRHKSSSKESNDNESDFEFYGGLVWKQSEYTSEYHYCYMPEDRTINGGGREDQLGQLRVIRDKCINLYKRYASKGQ